MYLKLTTSNWENTNIVINKKQKDYDYFKKDEIIIFVYGYPFDPSRSSWISANDICKLFLEKKLNFADEIEGVYSIIILDREKRNCHIIIDRYGVYSLFYTNNKSGIIISDKISEIVNHFSKIKLNQTSIIEYLTLGFKLGDKTHIDGIYDFESSKIYQINKNIEMKEKTYWNFFGASGINLISKEDFRKIFNKHIMNALKLEKKISLPLTGGIDTRTILSSCIPKKKQLHCYTHGVKNAPDVKLAQKICNHFDIKHNHYILDEKWIKNIPSMIIDKAESYNGLVSSLTFLHVEESYKKEKEKGNLFISGAMGNEIWRCLFGKNVVKCKNKDDVAQTLARILIKLHASVNTKEAEIYKNYNSEEVMSLLYNSIKIEFSNIPNINDPVALSELLVFRNWCSNWASNTIKSAGKHFKLFNGLLQKDLLQQTPLISLKEKSNGSMQKYIISKNNKYLAYLHLESGRIIDSSLMTRLKGGIILTSRYFRAASNEISRKIFNKDIFRIPYFTEYHNWLRNYHKKFLLDILNYNKMATKDLFKKEEFENIVNSFFKGDNYLISFIDRLISLEIWLKKICKDKEVYR